MVTHIVTRTLPDGREEWLAATPRGAQWAPRDSWTSKPLKFPSRESAEDCADMNGGKHEEIP